MNLPELLKELGMLIVDNDSAMELLGQISEQVNITPTAEPQPQTAPSGLTWEEEYKALQEKYVARFLSPAEVPQENNEPKPEEQETDTIDDLFEKGEE